MIAVEPHAPAETTAIGPQVRSLIELSRRQGSLRPLGRAQAILDAVDVDAWREEHAVLAGIIAQRRHSFDQARELLMSVLESNPDHRQAVLTLYSVALVQADYPLASELCDRMRDWGRPLLGASCRENIRALRGDEQGAMEALKAAVASNHADRNDWSYRWAVATLAEIARSVGHPETGQLWSRAYLADPENPYVVTEFADWLLAQGDYQRAQLLLSRIPRSDRVDVLRLIALEALDAPQAAALRRELDARFYASGTRAQHLHQWEYARYLLDVCNEPEAALAVARENWRVQKARTDRRLLERARQAAGVDGVTRAAGMP